MIKIYVLFHNMIIVNFGHVISHKQLLSLLFFFCYMGTLLVYGMSPSGLPSFAFRRVEIQILLLLESVFTIIWVSEASTKQYADTKVSESWNRLRYSLYTLIYIGIYSYTGLKVWKYMSEAKYRCLEARDTWKDLIYMPIYTDIQSMYTKMGLG